MKKMLLCLIMVCQFATLYAADEIIIDSQMSFKEAILGTGASEKIIEDLTIIDVAYYSFDGKIHRGQLVLHRDKVGDIKESFRIMQQEKFLIAKCIPIVKYGWSDNASMADNNTSMFNYRKIAGKKTLSNHSYGVAIDINPFQNPAVYKSGKTSPEGAVYNPQSPGTLTKESKVTVYLKKKGWSWGGGDWNRLKDWQHFDNP